jgi:small membrane protein
MRTLIIQLVLIAATGAIVWRFLSGVGQRSQAVRRIALLVFGVLAVASILFPETWTMAANFIGVGRGTDLILYMLVVAFFSFMATTFKRSRDADIRYTKLARRLALDEAVPPSVHRATTAVELPSDVNDNREDDAPGKV